MSKKREETLKKIVINEWNFFTNVNNIGKRAYCQDNSFTFIYSRLCYWNIYNDIILTSYLNDLENAKNNNRNLVTEKYAYMMQYTDPEYFNKIKKHLPQLYEDLCLDYYNPYENKCGVNQDYYVLVHSAIEYFIKK